MHFSLIAMARVTGLWQVRKGVGRGLGVGGGGGGEGWGPGVGGRGGGRLVQPRKAGKPGLQDSFSCDPLTLK